MIYSDLLVLQKMACSMFPYLARATRQHGTVLKSAI